MATDFPFELKCWIKFPFWTFWRKNTPRETLHFELKIRCAEIIFHYQTLTNNNHPHSGYTNSVFVFAIYRYMERVDNISFFPYFIQVSGSSFCSIVINWAILTVNIYFLYWIWIDWRPIPEFKIVESWIWVIESLSEKKNEYFRLLFSCITSPSMGMIIIFYFNDTI